MRYRFADFELDLAQRALRQGAQEIKLQPQVFTFLCYLVEQRERVVTKGELMKKLWPDARVTEGSLQRVASLARSALGAQASELIRTYPGHGYRFIAELRGEPSEASAALTLRPRYARSGDVHLAYATLGSGDVDIVLVLGWALPMQALFALPEAMQALQQLATLGRIILFDKRGTGLSDRTKVPPSMQERASDLQAVLDHVRSERAIVVGVSEGGPLAILFAAAHPHRVAALVLVGAFPRMASAPDYAAGWKRSELGRLKAYVSSQWGSGATILPLLPEAERERLLDWARAAESAGASPGAALDLLEMNVQVDVREQLANVQVPTVVLHARGDAVSHVDNGRYLAAHIPHAQLVEMDHDDHACLFAGRAQLYQVVKGIVERESQRR